MKSRHSQHGGALLVVLVTSVVMGISLASMLQYTGTQTRSIKRSQVWNAAIPAAEAGVEEALAHINLSAIGTNFAVNGWTASGNEFRKEGTVNGASYLTRISSDTWPVITSTGFTVDGRSTNKSTRTVLVTTTQAGSGMKGLVAKGNVSMNGGTQVDSFDSEDERYSTLGRYDPAKRKDGGYVASVLGTISGTSIYGTVGTGPSGSVSGNVGTFNWLSTNSGIQPGAYKNDVNVSFPPVQPPFAFGFSPFENVSVSLTNYSYWSTMVTTTNPPSTMPSGGVITNVAGSTNIVLYPSYPTGVASDLVTTNWTTVVQEKNLPSSGVYRNAVKHNGKWDYVLLTSYSYPYSSFTYTYSTTGTNMTVTTQTYDYAITDLKSRVKMSELRLSGGDRIICTATNGILYVEGDIAFTGNSELIVAPGASLQIYAAGEVKLAGNGVFNHTMDASKLAIFGLPTCTQITTSGNAAFTGVIYAPSANIKMNGGGNNVYDVVGAVVVNTAEMVGHFQFHYDERLGRSKILQRYVAASWREL